MTDRDPTWTDLDFDPFEERMRGVAHHGNTPIDVPYISHVTGNLWQGGCATGLVLPTNIEHVISLYPWERYTVKHELKSFEEIRMYDATDQAMDQVDEIAGKVFMKMQDGPTLVHCQAGLNRSGLIAARTLMIAGMEAIEAIALLRKQRANPNGTSAVLCNKAFERWLIENPVKRLDYDFAQSLEEVEAEMVENEVARQEAKIKTLEILKKQGLLLPPGLADEQDAGLDG